MELNPNHRVTAALHDQWHVIMAVLLHKHRHDLPRDVVITPDDIVRFQRAYPGHGAVVAHDKKDGLHLRLVQQDEANTLAASEGGLPT
jgi:hypothetical protein